MAASSARGGFMSALVPTVRQDCFTPMADSRVSASLETNLPAVLRYRPSSIQSMCNRPERLDHERQLGKRLALTLGLLRRQLHAHARRRGASATRTELSSGEGP